MHEFVASKDLSYLFSFNLFNESCYCCPGCRLNVNALDNIVLIVFVVFLLSRLSF
jgi:hypothetical protein